MHPAQLARPSEQLPLPVCPRCEDTPALEQFRRYESVTLDPLWYCRRCYGFWAVGDALSRGGADDRDEHPALTAALAPRGCKQCGSPGYGLKNCKRCGSSLLDPPLPCPQCRAVMQQEAKASFHVDHCDACHGTWFDVGELGAIMGRLPQQGLALLQVDEKAPDPVPRALLEIAFILLRRLILPF
jgi:Zn-finger nucleic acid-binding protein